MNNKRVTQRDIAAKCGVDHTTVSGVLTGKPTLNVRPSTRRRILSVSVRMGYRPDQTARLLRGVKSRTIGMIAGAHLVEPSYHRRIYASDGILAAGYRMISHDLFWDPDGLETIVDNLLDARVEGVLLSTFIWPQGETQIARLREAGIPVVSLAGCRLPGITRVAADNHRAMRELTRGMIRRGCRTLVHATTAPKRGGANQSDSLRERIDGFIEATRKLGIPETMVTVLHKPLGGRSPDIYHAGRVLMKQALSLKPQPEALLCCNDQLAMGALGFCVESGIEVPGKIAIAGFDNTCMGRYLNPPLTSVAQPVKAMARRAVQILLQAIENGPSLTEARDILIPCRIHQRGSS